MIHLTKQEAASFLVHYQHLSGQEPLKGKDGVLKYVQKVGCIQYDPLNICGKNSDLVLQSRVNGYQEQHLYDLLYQDRALVDGWDKQMAIYQASDWNLYAAVRQKRLTEIKQWLGEEDFLQALEYVDEITELVRESGPLLSAQINLGKRRDSVWGHKKTSTATLDYLFHSGMLGIYKRNGTQKVYELMERLLPEELFHQPWPFADEKEFYKWYVNRRIGSVGLVWNKAGGNWYGHFVSDRSIRNQVLAELKEEQLIEEVMIEGLKDIFYMRKEDSRYLDYQRFDDQVRFLAPLDNLIWDRTMIEQIFGFQYTWEVYVPAAKRKYGYYVLPVLYKNQLIARFEPEYNKKEKILTIKNWWWEDDIKKSDRLMSKVKKAIVQFGRFLGAVEIDESGLDYTQS